MSSVREVLPGRQYFLPQTQDKADPLTITEEEFIEKICKKALQYLTGYLFLPYRIKPSDCRRNLLQGFY